MKPQNKVHFLDGLGGAFTPHNVTWNNQVERRQGPLFSCCPFPWQIGGYTRPACSKIKGTALTAGRKAQDVARAATRRVTPQVRWDAACQPGACCYPRAAGGSGGAAGYRDTRSSGAAAISPRKAWLKASPAIACRDTRRLSGAGSPLPLAVRG